MKKYINPTIRVVEIDAQNILDGSPTGTIGGETSEAGARERGLFDWNDEE